MREKIIEVFFEHLSSAVFSSSVKTTALTEEETESLYKLSLSHDLAHLVAYSLAKNGKVYGQFDRQHKLAMYRTELIGYEYGRMCETLEEAEIDFIPLKGSVIRSYYPSNWMRTSCDIDLLVREEDLTKAAEVLKNELVCEIGEKEAHDLSLYTESGVHIELHFALVEQIESADKVLDRVWETSRLKEGTKHTYTLSDSMFYFYHILHMAKHVVHGGCGVRPFLDLAIMDKMEMYSPENTDGLLKEGKMYDFAINARKLSRVWFMNEEHNEVTRKLSDFILGAGVYGSAENQAAVSLSKKKSKFKIFITAVFPPYHILKVKYPRLEKHRYLLLWYQMKNTLRKIKDKNRVSRAIGRINEADNVSREKRDETADLMNKLGL